MDYLLPLAGLAFVHLLAVASPGPSFVLIAQTAAAHSRRAALVGAIAMTIGATVWAVGAMLGLQALFARFETLYLVLRIIGGLYLVWLAIRLWRTAGTAAPELPAEAATAASLPVAGAFRRALLVQLGNPKVAVFFSSIFLALLPHDAPAWVGIAAIGIVMVDEFAWYALVALTFSAGRAQSFYRRARATIDRITGVVLGGLGLRLVLDH